MNSLKKNSKVDDVEDGNLDDGRFFVHLKTGWDFGTDPRQVVRTKSFDSVAAARKAIAAAKKI